MEGTEKLHTEKYKIIFSKNYDTSCTLTSLPVLDFEYVKSLILLYTVYMHDVFL